MPRVDDNPPRIEAMPSSEPQVIRRAMAALPLEETHRHLRGVDGVDYDTGHIADRPALAPRPSRLALILPARGVARSRAVN